MVKVLLPVKIIPMALADNSKTYLKQMSFEEIAVDFWERVKKGAPESFLWEQGQPKPFAIVLLYGPSQKSEFKSAVFDIDKTYFEVLKDKWAGKQVLLKFKFSSDQQFFTSGTLEYLPTLDKLAVLLGKPFFVSTKRSSCRYSPSKFDRIAVVVGEKKFDCYDISSGGFSTLVKRADVPPEFVKGAAFDAAELAYNGRKFPIPKAVLVNLIDPKDDPAWIKLAFKFEGLKPEEEDRIWVEVNRSVQKIAELL